MLCDDMYLCTEYPGPAFAKKKKKTQKKKKKRPACPSHVFLSRPVVSWMLTWPPEEQARAVPRHPPFILRSKGTLTGDGLCWFSISDLAVDMASSSSRIHFCLLSREMARR